MNNEFDKRQAAARTSAAARKRLEEMEQGKDSIPFTGPRSDGSYVVEFRTASGETLAISIPRGETAVIEYFRRRAPDGITL
jgi:hypothetical protein